MGHHDVLLSQSKHSFDLHSLLFIAAIKATKLNGRDKTCDEAGAKDNGNRHDCTYGQSTSSICQCIDRLVHAVNFVTSILNAVVVWSTGAGTHLLFVVRCAIALSILTFAFYAAT